MKIGLVCPYDYDSLGGVQSHIRHLAAALTEMGHEVRVLAPRGQGEPGPNLIQAGECKRIRFSETAFEVTWIGWSELLSLRQRLKREQFDLLHFHTIWNPFMPLQILLSTRVPTVATFHDTAPDTLLGRILARTLMPAAAAVLRGLLLTRSIAVSPSPVPHLTRFYRGDLKIVPNGVEFAEYRPPQNQPLPNYRDDKFNILYLGRLEERKGVSYLLEAYARLRASRDDVRLLVAGDGHLRQELEAYVDQHSLPDVEMLGVVDEETKRRLYATCDIYCSPAVAGESFGIVLLEAMASGKPAVGAANSGYRWVLQGEGRELLVPPRDAAALEQKLNQLLSDADLRQRLGCWGVEEAARYDWREVAKQVLEVYREALR
ncbi:MAG: glycosyltransferase family 4 protein [Candidatus Eremiobacteraeota bacterium]|nr:glycosyltransferase family 4 protein [Candidatus Eremiobacteraeota bacterium]